MQATIDKFIEEVKLNLAKASSMYGIKLDTSNVQINCDVRGTTAGWAHSTPSRTRHKLRFNTEAILKYNAEMIADTIPHEVAHLVCNVLPRLGSNHDFGWKRVCRELGGDDSRTHSYVLTPVRNSRVEYVLDSGRVCHVGPKHHKAIQGGRNDFFMRNPKEYLRADQWVDYDYQDVPNQTVVIPGLNIVRADVPDLTKLLSKRQKAEAIYQANKHLERRHVIALFMDKAEMTKAGASTYYQNFKSGKY